MEQLKTFNLVDAVAQSELLDTHIERRVSTIQKIGSESATVKVDLKKDPSKLDDRDFSILEKIGRVRQKVTFNIEKMRHEKAVVDARIASFAPQYLDTLSTRSAQLDRLRDLHANGFVNDNELAIVEAGVQHYASLFNRSSTLRESVALQEKSEDQETLKKNIYIDAQNRVVKVADKPLEFKTETQWRVIGLFHEHNGKLSPKVLAQVIENEGLTHKQHSPVSGLIENLRKRLGPDSIKSILDQKLGERFYFLDAEYAKLPEEIQEEEGKEDKDLIKKLQIMANPNDRTVQIEGKTITLASEARWQVFNKLATTDKGITGAELDELLKEHGIVSAHPNQGPRTVSSIRDALKEHGHVIKTEIGEKNTRIYSVDADITFLPTIEKPEQPQLEKLLREVDKPFIDTFSRADIAVVASTCLTNQEQITQILAKSNSTFLEKDVLRDLTEVIGDETLLPLTEMPEGSATQLVNRARQQALTKVIELFDDTGSREDRLNNIYAQNPDLWTLLLNLSELSDLICQYSDSGTTHPLIEVFSAENRTLLFNMDNKKQIPQEFRFRPGVTLESIIKRIESHRS